MRLTVKVVPKSSRDEIAGWLGDALKICVTAAPERGRANEAVVRLVAAALGIPERALRVVAGASSARKVLEVEGIGEEDARRRLPSRD